jgi:ribonucleoside-triphosphate reductase (thioredoxin)
MHWPESMHYIRRMRLSIHSDLVTPLREAGYHIEPAVDSPDTTLVVEVPVKIEDNIRPVNDVSLWEQLSMAAFLQRYWSDNQVSATITFHPETEGSQIAPALNYFQYQLKGVSFLPLLEDGSYPQMVYEAITEGEYHTRAANLQPINFGVTKEAADAERFCDSSGCVI